METLKIIRGLIKEGQKQIKQAMCGLEKILEK